jgi:hypothetical protein
MPPTQDVEAYRLYLQAMGTGHGTVPSLRHTIVLLVQARARDPSFADALVPRAFIQGELANNGAPMVAEDALPYVRKALRAGRTAKRPSGRRRARAPFAMIGLD